MARDRVFISDLRAETRIGIYEWERRIRQVVSVDLEMACDVASAAAADRIEATLNYKAVAKRLVRFINESRFDLVETLAERCAELVLSEFRVSWLSLRISKPGAVRGSRDVGVIIERERNHGLARVYLGLGSNTEPRRNLSSALHELREHFGELTRSPVYRSPAVGFEGADFYNLVAGLDTGLGVHAVNDAIHAIEDRHGRRRDAPRFSDRTLDIDLLLYDDLVVRDPRLELPRPEIERYAFVLKPLADIAPALVHPTAGKTMAELWDAFPDRDGPLTPVQLETD